MKVGREARKDHGMKQLQHASAEHGGRVHGIARLPSCDSLDETHQPPGRAGQLAHPVRNPGRRPTPQGARKWGGRIRQEIRHGHNVGVRFEFSQVRPECCGQVAEVGLETAQAPVNEQGVQTLRSEEGRGRHKRRTATFTNGGVAQTRQLGEGGRDRAPRRMDLDRIRFPVHCLYFWFCKPFEFRFKNLRESRE